MKVNQLKYGIYLSYASIFISNISSLILTPFIVRSLGQSEYGLYMLIGSFVGYIAVLDFGLGNATVRFVSKYRAEKDKKGEENFLSFTFIMYAIISVIVVLIGTVLYFNLGRIFNNSLTTNEVETAKVLFLILIINMAFTLPMNAFTGIINAYERFIIPRVLVIGRLLLRVIIILVLLSMGYKAIAIVLVDTILNLSMLLISMTYSFMKLKVSIKLHSLNIDLFKEIFSYSSFIFISVVVDQIYWRIGHLVLGVVASTNDVALFAIGMMFGQYFITFSTAISGVFLPKITKMVTENASGEKLTDLLIKTGRLQFLVLGLVFTGFILFGEKFIFLWLGPGYYISWVIALIVMFPLTIVLLQTIGISILQAKNMHKFRAITYLCISILNLFISIYLARIEGALGAAIGTTLSLILGNIIAMNFYYHFKVGLNMPRFYKELVNGLLISMVGSVGLGLITLTISSYSWVGLIIQCFIYSITYIVIMWLFGMNNQEKRIFKNEFSKIRMKVL